LVIKSDEGENLKRLSAYLAGLIEADVKLPPFQDFVIVGLQLSDG
jgi:hypothetical protein